MRGNDHGPISISVDQIFQFMPLHKRRPRSQSKAADISNFNSRLYMRGNRAFVPVFFRLEHFNSCLYMRGNIQTWHTMHLCTYFNSCLYMRGNGHDVYRISANGVFQFMPLHERQHERVHCIGEKGWFQFMPLHERQRIAFRIPKVDIFYFNSRLYMRGNWNYWKTCRWWHISIHASTWEATNRSASAWRRWRNFNSRLYMRGNQYYPLQHLL